MFGSCCQPLPANGGQVVDGPDWGGVLHLVWLHLVGEELAAAGGAVGVHEAQVVAEPHAPLDEAHGGDVVLQAGHPVMVRSDRFKCDQEVLTCV